MLMTIPSLFREMGVRQRRDFTEPRTLEKRDEKISYVAVSYFPKSEVHKKLAKGTLSTECGWVMVRDVSL